MGGTFAINSDYIEDFNSSCFTEGRAFYKRFMDEFNSHVVRLKLILRKENKKEDVSCLSIG